MTAKKKIVKKKKATSVKRPRQAKKSVSTIVSHVKAAVVLDTTSPISKITATAANKYDVFRVFRNTWTYFKNAFNVNSVVAIISCLGLTPILFWFFKVVSDKSKPLPSDMILIFILYFVAVIIFSYFIIFMITVYHRRGLEKDWLKPGVADILKTSFGGLFRAFVLTLIAIACMILFLLPFILIGVFGGEKVMTLVIISGYISMLILMIYLMLTYAPAFIIAIIEPKIIKALKESAEITKGKRLKILLTYFGSMVIMIAVELVLMIPIGIIAALIAAKIALGVMIGIGAILFIIIMAVIMQLMYAFYYSIYNEVKTTVK